VIHRSPLLILSLLLCHSLLPAQILTETGTLRGFCFGEAPGCAYDNYVSHLVEGIADQGANDYNPHDPQTDGFGQFVVLGEDSTALLQTFKTFFLHCARGEFELAENLRTQELSGYPYHLVELTDTLRSRQYYLFREELDSSYVDNNHPPEPEDDEVGSFNYGWGLYIFDPAARNPQTQVQVPHVNDDYLTPALGLDLFFTLEAGALFIAGAGREVAWTEEGGYSNNKSLSDPTRNGYHPFQMAHEAFFDHNLDELGRQPLTLQVHSYDSNNRQHPSVIIAPRNDDQTYNLPLYDWSGLLGGCIDRTSIPVHPAGFIGNPEAVSVESFLGVRSTPHLVVCDSSGTEHELSNVNELLGYSGNHQLNYREGEITPCSDVEWVMHLEFDELPNTLPEDTTEEQFYAAPGFPVTWRNFTAVTDYYHPVAANLNAALDTMAAYQDTLAPVPPESLQVIDIHWGRITLGWQRAYDPHFFSYRLYWALEPPVDTLSAYIDAETYGYLCRQTTESLELWELSQEEYYFFRLGAVDRYGNHSELTPLLAVCLEPDGEPRIEIESPAPAWLWWPAAGGSVRAVLSDYCEGIDGGALQYRRDWHQDGDYNDAEDDWETLPAVPNAYQIEAEYIFDFETQPDGACFELRVRDSNQGDWVYSGSYNDPGISDDWRIYIDDAPPAAVADLSVAAVQYDEWFDLTWTPLAADSSFETYLLYWAYEAEPDSGSAYFDLQTHPVLGLIDCDSLRIDLLYELGVYQVAIAARDWVGNLGPLSPPVTVELTAGPSRLQYHHQEITDDDNGNGVAEAGETVELLIHLENVGTDTCWQIGGQLSSDLPWLTVTTADAAYPSLAPGETAPGMTPFCLQIDLSAPPLFQAELLLRVTYDGYARELPVHFEGGQRQLYYLHDVESGEAGWLHEAAADWNDEWHLSQEDAHSSIYSWKCGDTGSGDYDNHLDARLCSPLLAVRPYSRLVIMHRLQAEVDGSEPDSAFDGGIVEISVEGDSGWTQLLPLTGGYNAWFKWLSGGNPTTHPFPPGIPCFSGEFTWREEQFDLGAWADSTVQLRFRFGSDDSITQEGWYIDDIALWGAPLQLTAPVVQCQLLTGTLQLSWEPVAGATGYRIYRSDIPAGDYELLLETSETSEILSLTGNAGFYRVTAFAEP